MLNSKQPITNLMINTRQTKVKLILSCMMEKVDLKSDEVIVKEQDFILKQKSTQKVLTLVKCFGNERNCFGVFGNISKTKKKLEIPFSFESGSSHGKV